MTPRLADRKIVVVGAGTQPSNDPDAPIGNGRAIAVLAAREGASVACVDMNRGAAQATADLVQAEGAKAVVIAADVSDPEQCAALVTESIDALGGIDGIVLNVGIGGGVGLEGTTAEDWDRVSNVNLPSPLLDLCGGQAAPPRRFVDRVHLVGGRSTGRQPHPGVRHYEGGVARSQPPCGGRMRASGHPIQRRVPRLDRHTARSRRFRRPTVA